MRLTPVLVMLLLPAAGCSTMRSILATDSGRESGKPISNPFSDFQANSQKAPGESMIFRTKRGNGSLEVEIPRANQDMSDFVIPISPAMRAMDRGPASESEASRAATEKNSDTTYEKHDAGVSDHEITQSFPHGSDENEAKRRDLEEELGLIRTEEAAPERQKSYLASVDKVKQLYHSGRYEAALLETDEMIREYPTNPRLYEMRGTLFERVGHLDLALKAWKQALRFNPDNEPLKRFIDRKEHKRSLASP